MGFRCPLRLALLIPVFILGFAFVNASSQKNKENGGSITESLELDLIPTTRKLVPLSGFFEGQNVRSQALASCAAKAYELRSKHKLFPLTYEVSLVPNHEFKDRENLWTASCIFEVLDMPKIQSLMGHRNLPKQSLNEHNWFLGSR